MSEAFVNAQASAGAASSSRRGAEAPGWFGKIPNLGDFVSRRLPEDFIHDWDDWLQRSLVKARKELGADWLASYLVAPVRRFWLAPGVLGKTGWAGVLMPSVDSVGRHFPLTIASAIGDGEGNGDAQQSLAAALRAVGWFGAIDDAARKVLDVHFTADDLEHELGLIAPLCDERGERDERDERDERAAASNAELATPEASPDADAAQLLAASLMSMRAPRTSSVWWCGDALVQAQIERFGALPPASSFATLLRQATPP